MINPNNSKYYYIRELRQQGKTANEIHEITGMNKSNIYRVTSGVVSEKDIDSYLSKNKLTIEQQMEWTKAVNKIRVYCGKKPFLMPWQDDAHNENMRILEDEKKQRTRRNDAAGNIECNSELHH